MTVANSLRNGPSDRGRFGDYGGRFVAETLMPLILEVRAGVYLRRKPIPAAVPIWIISLEALCRTAQSAVVRHEGRPSDGVGRKSTSSVTN